MYTVVCTRMSGQDGSGGNKQFALGYLVSVFLVGTFQEGMSQGNPLGDLVHVYCFVKGNLYYIIYVSVGLFHCFFFFCFFFYFLSVLVITICYLELFP